MSASSLIDSQQEQKNNDNQQPQQQFNQQVLQQLNNINNNLAHSRKEMNTNNKCHINIFIVLSVIVFIVAVISGGALYVIKEVHGTTATIMQDTQKINSTMQKMNDSMNNRMNMMNDSIKKMNDNVEIVVGKLMEETYNDKMQQEIEKNQKKEKEIKEESFKDGVMFLDWFTFFLDIFVFSYIYILYFSFFIYIYRNKL